MTDIWAGEGGRFDSYSAALVLGWFPLVRVCSLSSSLIRCDREGERGSLWCSLVRNGWVALPRESHSAWTEVCQVDSEMVFRFLQHLAGLPRSLYLLTPRRWEHQGATLSQPHFQSRAQRMLIHKR